MNTLLNNLEKQPKLALALVILVIIGIALSVYAVKLAMEPYLRTRHMFYPILHNAKRSKLFKKLKKTHPNMQAIITVSGPDKGNVIYWLETFSFLKGKDLIDVNTKADPKKERSFIILKDEVSGNQYTKNDYLNLFDGIRIHPDSRVDIVY